MNTIIKPSAAIRQNYNEISALCKEKGVPDFDARFVSKEFRERLGL